MWRLLLFTMLLMIPTVIITLTTGIKPQLPILNNGPASIQHIIHPALPTDLNERELKKYKGFTDFLNEKKQLDKSGNKQNDHAGTPIRAAFYVDWDPQSFYSLQKNIGSLDIVFPEWFFIDPSTDTLRAGIDTSALALMKKANVKIIPLINNINEQKGEGEFDGNILHRLLHNKLKQQRLVNDIERYIRLYDLQGINIDFEEFKEKSDEPIVAFQRELYQKLHHEDGLLVTQDIMPNDADFNVKELAKYNDYIVLMAYDEHYSTSVAGPVCSQRWIEKVLDENAAVIPSEKIIL